MNWEERAKALQAKLDDAEFKIEQLESALSQHGVPAFCGMTTSEMRIGQLLRERSPSVVMKSAIYDMLYAFRHDDEMPEPKIVDVLVCKLRKKVSSQGIEIETAWGRGYSMPSTAAEAWDDAAGKVAGAQS